LAILGRYRHDGHACGMGTVIYGWYVVDKPAKHMELRLSQNLSDRPECRTWDGQYFIAENLHGEIIVIEIPDGDPSKSKIYIGPQLFGDNADLTPVTLSFKDVNGDGKPDMLMHVQDQTIIFLNDGTQFKTPKQ